MITEELRTITPENLHLHREKWAAQVVAGRGATSEMAKLERRLVAAAAEAKVAQQRWTELVAEKDRLQQALNNGTHGEMQLRNQLPPAMIALLEDLKQRRFAVSAEKHKVVRAFQLASDRANECDPRDSELKKNIKRKLKELHAAHDAAEKTLADLLREETEAWERCITEAWPEPTAKQREAMAASHARMTRAGLAEAHSDTPHVAAELGTPAATPEAMQLT